LYSYSYSFKKSLPSTTDLVSFNNYESVFLMAKELLIGSYTTSFYESNSFNKRFPIFA